ncbi:hypothetical protein AB0I81_35980 [Nonomuraea sp. NPDC050404]|uniref:hypothetical protein n=1 Tax=Nonomuraea sp. NPDC050404 TaxID=3155783 RepID=UPI0033DC0CD4
MSAQTMAYAYEAPTTQEKDQVHALIGQQEPHSGLEHSPRAGILILLLVLSADPIGEEPVEDAFDGMIQKLAHAAAV